MRPWTQDEQVRFLRAALAEAGYPDADVRPNPGDPEGIVVATGFLGVPEREAYRAGFLMHRAMDHTTVVPCFDCWRQQSSWHIEDSVPVQPCEHEPEWV